MKRKKLRLENIDENKSKNVDKKVVEKIAEQQSFTKREFDKKRSIYQEQFNARCRKGINDLAFDIIYLKKIKKQELLEQALLAYLEKNNLNDLIAKYHNIIPKS